jgi:hypothetical protein
MMSAAIHSLPVELLEKIYGHLDPASHLNFALVDKYIFHYSRSILERHVKYNKSYAILADLHPADLITVLRDVAVDHIAAWHLQAFQGLNSKILQTTYRPCETELVEVCKAAKNAMGTNGLPTLGAVGLNRIRKGDFEAIQVAILALSSGLKTFKSDDFLCRVDTDKIDDVTYDDDDFWNKAQTS